MDSSIDGQPYFRVHNCSVPRATASTASYGCTSEQSHLLPIANVGRIMKQALPQHAKISKRAKETIQECASEFISFVTEEASDRCRKDDRKTIDGDDICCAMKTLGLDEYADAMKRYLCRYREREEKTASMKCNKPVQIDVRNELPIFRSSQRRDQLPSKSPHNVAETRKFF
ncbi:nuclear transcription factor Y subunit B-4-like [Phoenix dactylifera]|uniref:Nuclear transcription factor Y subunit B-4-like n=1 Tax=Phoenix dactylifera TaxID=42345 RepID=A0A8B7D5B0_PHODC|nr:nuclear transcription factor Y subunit B-4-like [Phoenix dactylifera]